MTLASTRWAKSALELVADPVVVTDQDGAIEWVNEAFTRQNLYRLDEVRGRTPRVLKSGLTPPERYEQLWATVRAGRTWTGEVVNQRKDGTHYAAELTVAPLRDAGGSMRLVATHRDVTAKKRTESGFRSLLEIAPDAALVQRGRRVLWANGAALRLLGGPDGEVGLDLLQQAGAQVKEGAIEELEVAGTADGTRTVELRRLTVEFEGAPAILLIARDRTEQRQLERRAIELDQLLALGRLASGVADELSRPLASVAHGLALAKQGLGGGKARTALDEAVAEAEQGVAQVQELARELVTLGRADSAGPAPFPFARAVRAAERLGAHALGPQVTVVHELDDALQVLAREGRTIQSMLHLFVNAAQATASLGRPARVVLRVKQIGADAVAEVEDDGPGVPAELHERIFEPFFTTGQPGAGPGLGLAIARRSAEADGGSLELNLPASGGACFRLRLPRG